MLENVENLFNLDQNLVGSSETICTSSSNEDADFGDWLAGFFDAESYFSIRNKYTLTLSVGQKDKEILEKIKSSFGVGKIYYDTSWKRV